jgi:hypothetical protein
VLPVIPTTPNRRPDLESAVEVASLLPREYSIEVRPTLGIDV